MFSGSNRFAGILVATNGNNRFSGDGSGLTNLNASQFSTGTISDTRLSANVALLDAVQTFAAAKSFGAGAQLLGDPGTAAGPGLSFQGNTNTGVFRPAANSVAIATSGSERLRIDSTGKVGIGTNAPANLLAVAGAGTGSGVSGGVSEVVGHFINTNASSHSAVSVDATAGQDSILYFAEAGQAWWDLRHDSSDTHKLNFRYQGGANVNSTLMVIASNGNVGIGLTAPTNKLHVAGGVSATAFVTTSDHNTKENFAPVSPAAVLAKVTALPINTWNFKELKDGRHLGPTAQDFYSAFKLGGSETGITTVDADGVALAAIQGLNEKLENSVREKEARIAALEAILEELRAMVCNLAKDRLASAAAD